MKRTMPTPRMLSKNISLFILAMLVVLAAGCRNPAQPVITTGLGSLELRLGDVARSVLPVYDYAYATDFYHITGNGPNGSYFEVAEFTGNLYSIIDLEPGSWDIALNALNAIKEVIAETIFQTTILADQTTTASPLLFRLEGTGALDLSLRWYSSREYIAVEARLESTMSKAIVLDQTEWAITETDATIMVAPLPVGSYLLTLSLWANGQDPDSTTPAYTSETPVAVEIYYGYTSKGFFTIATWVASQDFLYHPDHPVHTVDFGSEAEQNLTIRGAAGLQLYLVKVNTADSKVDAQATGSASSTWTYLANHTLASASPINDQPGMERPVRREHKASLEFNANPPPMLVEAPARTLARTIAYGETTSDYTEGITKKNFWVEDSTGIFISIPTTLRALGKYSYVWVADANHSTQTTIGDNKITTVQAKLMGAKFDGTAEQDYKDGIFRNVSTTFGHEYGGGAGGDGGRDGDQHISILLYDIDGDYTSNQTSGVAGYFWSKDFYTQEQLGIDLKTNYTEIFYMDAYFADRYPEFIYSTMAHEHQHMIHFNMKSVRLGLRSATWFNEMCSMVAEDLVLGNIGLDPLLDGPQSRLDIFAYHYAESGIRDWLDDDEVLKSYAGAFAFGAYLTRNFGGAGFFHELLHNDMVNEAAIDAAMAAPGALGNGQGFSQELLRYGEVLVLTAIPASEGLRSMNRQVASFVADGPAGDGISYTALPIKLATIGQYDLETQSGNNQLGMRSYLPSQELELRPYGNSMHTQDSWTNIPGDLAISLVAPGNSAVQYYLVVK